MTAKERRTWCVVRLITVQRKGEMGRLLFATITELAQDRPVPAHMRGCSGQLIPDTTLSFSSARAGANPSLN
jgi:hypothetical protein